MVSREILYCQTDRESIHEKARGARHFLADRSPDAPAGRRTPDDARKAQFLATLPGLWQEKRLIGSANEPVSLFMTALVDVYGLGYVFVAGFPAAQAQVCRTLTGTPAWQ
jgi:hypothetical protein